MSPMKLRKYFLFLFLLIIACTFQSCFEIIEEVEMHSDGTGQLMFTLNLSQSKSKMASIMLLDSINGYKVPSKKDIKKSIDELVADLKKAEGVSNVKKKEDFFQR